MEPPSPGIITVLNQTNRRVRTASIRHAAAAALARHELSDGEVCILLTGDEEIQKLNRDFRGIDEPTDVLTFPAGEPHSEGPRILGDIAISLDYATRQAAARGVSLTQELGFLAIHGALHLAGFDDETEPERAAMVREMNVVALEVGLKPDEEWSSILHEAAK